MIASDARSRPPVLVLGVGNVLLGDEGVGIHALATLERRYRLPSTVATLDGGTAGIELLRHLAGRELVVIIDAMAGGAPPGTVRVFRDQEVGMRLQQRISPHQLGLSDLLAAAFLTGDSPERLYLVGIEPLDLEPATTLSPAVAPAVDRAVAEVAAILAAHGHPCHPQESTGPVDDRPFWQQADPA